MTQHQFKVGQKVKVVRGFNEDPEAVDGNNRIKSGLMTTVVHIPHNTPAGIDAWVQIEYTRANGDTGLWYIRPHCLVPQRKKVYV